jgi:DNA-binding MarR family transcriptional regulator
MFARAVGEIGLTPAHAEIISVLAEWGPMNLRDLGEMIVCEASSPSRIVETMVQRGLLNRSTDPSSRRAVVLELTDTGRTKVPALRQIEAAMDQATAGLLDHARQEIVGDALWQFLDGTAAGQALARRFARIPRS